jgi:hypothetical protein
MDTNVTPRASRRKDGNFLVVTPEKRYDRAEQPSEYNKSFSVDPTPNIMNWESSDAHPIPDEGILRDFDLNTKYGPCCSLTREERWTRAFALRLNPPVDILRLIRNTSHNTSVIDVHMKQVS